MPKKTASRPSSGGGSNEWFDLLERLTAADGTSGNEEAVGRIMASELGSVAHELRVDAIGNVIATTGRGGAPSIALFAHMDEVGLLVKEIRSDGYLRFSLSGGVDRHILPSQWVRIATSRGVVRGVVSSAPGHLISIQGGRSENSEQFIDVGAANADEASELGIRVGDSITYDRALTRSANGKYVIGKAIDNRLGCTVMVQVFRSCAVRGVSHRLHAAATTMEEVGEVGARAAAKELKPDVAIIVDGIPGRDPLLPPEVTVVEVGRGPVISRAEAGNPHANVVPKWLMDFVIGVAERNGIPYQVNVDNVFDSDAAGIKFTEPATPVVPIYIPRKNSHTPAEIASVEDINNAVKLATLVVRGLDSEWSRITGTKAPRTR